MKKCPYCAEDIQDDAIICRYCNSELVNQENKTGSQSKGPFKNKIIQEILTLYKDSLIITVPLYLIYLLFNSPRIGWTNIITALGLNFIIGLPEIWLARKITRKPFWSAALAILFSLIVSTFLLIFLVI